MSGTNILIPAGFDCIFYAQNDDDGFPLGGTGVATAGDIDGSPALRLDGANTVDMSIPESEIVNVLGDDKPMVNFSFLAANLPQGALEVAAKDLDAMGYFSNVTPRTQAGIKQLPLGTSNVPASVALIVQQQAKSWQDGFEGIPKRSGYYVPACELRPLGAPYTQRAHNMQRYSINASNAARHIWGETFSIANDTVENAPIIDMSMDDLVHQHAFRGNAIRTVFNLRYTPLVPATRSSVTVEGVLQTYTVDYAIATNVLTFVAAPANNARIIVSYEFDRSELA